MQLVWSKYTQYCVFLKIKIQNILHKVLFIYILNKGNGPYRIKK